MKADKIKLLVLQQEALKIYFTHFFAFISHLKINKKNRNKLHKLLDELIQEKINMIDILKQMEKK